LVTLAVAIQLEFRLAVRLSMKLEALMFLTALVAAHQSGPVGSYASALVYPLRALMG
jgi:hypothetical protein